MPNYRRLFVPGGTYVFTVAIADRNRSWLVDRIDALSIAFRIVRAWRPYSMPACVILPDHLHCIWSLPEGDCAFPERWNRIKGEFSRRLDDDAHRSRSRVSKRERGLWQRRYWERLVRDDRDLRNCIDYIHRNPVKHGLVARVADWPYSSFHRFVRDGRLPVDWAG
jgi:putative transposase